MPVCRTLALAALFAATAVTTTAADWPQWRGPNRDGHSADTGLLKEWPKGGPKLAWKVNALGFGYSSPAVVGDRLYVMGTDPNQKETGDFVVCLSARDGSQVWKTPTPPLDPKAKFLEGWGGGPRSTPTIDGDSVYVLGPRGDLLCLKAADGSKVWGVNLVNDFGGGIPQWGYSESVLIDGDRLICTPGGSKGTVLALDKKNGLKVWQSADLKDGAGYASVIAAEVGGVRQYITQTNAAAVGVRAADGKPLWRVAELARRIAVIPTPVVDKEYAFFTAGYNAGCELIRLDPDGQGGTKATAVYTKNNVLANHHGGVVRVGDYVYGHDDIGKRWVCLDYKKNPKEPVWEHKPFGKGSVCVADGRLYCYDEKTGAVALVTATPDGWTEVGRFDLPEKTKLPRGSGLIWAHPVVANGKLYLRDQDLLFCYDVSLPRG